MLTNTFCCFDGLSGAAERRLWSQGFLTWRELLVLQPKALSSSKLARVRAQIRQAELALEGRRFDYFLNRLRYPDKVRVLPHVIAEVGFLDIETTGLEARAEVTTVALVTRGRRRCYVRGMNLDELLRDLTEVSLLVTYNGASFDLPRLRKAFRIDLSMPHLDLRYCLEALGYRGGLKRCEAQLGFQRSLERPLEGADAVVLWRRWEEDRDEGALTELVRYNLTDALALEYLTFKVYNSVMSSFPGSVGLSIPEVPHLEGVSLAEVL